MNGDINTAGETGFSKEQRKTRRELARERHRQKTQEIKRRVEKGGPRSSLISSSSSLPSPTHPASLPILITSSPPLSPRSHHTLSFPTLPSLSQLNLDGKKSQVEEEDAVSSLLSLDKQPRLAPSGSPTIFIPPPFTSSLSDPELLKRPADTLEPSSDGFVIRLPKKQRSEEALFVTLPSFSSHFASTLPSPWSRFSSSPSQTSTASSPASSSPLHISNLLLNPSESDSP